MKPKKLTTIRLSDAAQKHLDAIRKITGIKSQSAIIEAALATWAAQLGSKPKETL